MKKTVYCIYHSADQDGHVSGAIVQLYCRRTGHQFVAIPHDYHDPKHQLEQLVANVRPEDTVVMVDIGLDQTRPDLMLSFRDMLDANFLWIDHHKSAIDHWAEAGEEFNGCQEVGRSAAELAWEFFFDTTPPPLVLLTGVYDTWRKKDEYWEEALHNNYYWRYRQTCPALNEDLCDELDFGGNCSTSVLAGKSLYDFAAAQFQATAEHYAFEAEVAIGGKLYTALCLNSPFNSSLSFGSLFRAGKHDFMLIYNQLPNGRWKYSLYHESPLDYDINVGAIANSQGGGGHEGAAGFTLERPVYFTPCENA